MKLIIFLMAAVMAQDIPTPASLLGPQHFNHHAFDAERILKSLNLPVPTTKGPVLFPNDAPPPPRPPLVVTSRPLSESIARSNLNTNNSVAQPSNNGASFVPYLARMKDYRPFFRAGGEVGTQGSYQTQTSLPSLYQTIASQATIADPEQRAINYKYQIKEPEYTHQQSNEVHENPDYGNYAFSYAVKDKNTGDDFSHSQQSRGSATNGEYRVRLPDGRMQIVSYTADENGYKADVRYDETSANGDNRIVNNNYLSNEVTNHLTGNKNRDYNDLNVYNNVLYDNNYLKNQETSHLIDNNKDYNNINIYKNVYDSNYVNNKVTSPATNNNNGYNYKNAYNNIQHDNNYIDKVTNQVTDSNIKLYNNVQFDSKNFVDNKLNNQISDTNIDAEQRDFKNEYNYDSKEYYNDYSSEYNENYLPHRNKFANLVTKSNNVVVSTVRPSYEEIKNLFTPNKFYNKHIDSTTQNPFVTTDNVVLIGAKPNLYTNIGSTISPITDTTVTPKSYLVSTIRNLKNKLNFNQPVLSERFIDKINKYLKFN